MRINVFGGWVEQTLSKLQRLARLGSEGGTETVDFVRGSIDPTIQFPLQSGFERP